MFLFTRIPGLSGQDLIRSKTANVKGHACVLDVEISPTAAQSYFVFTKVVESFKNLPKVKAAQNGCPDIVYQHRIGLRPEGRSSQYDLFWFKSHPNEIFAVDTRDYNYVFCKTFLGAF